MIGGPKGSQSRRSRRESLIAAALPSGGLFIALVFLMVGTGAMADAPSVYVEHVDEMNRGAYLLTDQGIFKLHHWHLPLSELPSDAPTLDAERVHALLVVTRRPGQAEACHLYRLEATAVVDWHSTQQDSHQLVLDPGPLPPGGYLLTVPTDDLFGGKTHYYFRLQ